MKVSEVPQAATHISMELTAMSKGSRALKHGWSWFVQGFYQNVRGSFVLHRSHKVEHSSPYVVLTGFEGFGAASSTAARGGCRAHCEEGLRFEVIALSPEDPGTQFPECTKQHFISIYPSRQSRRPSPCTSAIVGPWTWSEFQRSLLGRWTRPAELSEKKQRRVW